MRILAIETSCDDTAVAILEVSKTGKFSVLANIIASQIEVHKQYGGVYPFMAKREHEKNLGPTFKEALKKAKISEKDVDLIAVTNGPGLEPCLWVGVNFAKELAKKWNVPLVPINHIEAHILVNFLGNKNIKFPAVCLVVSGGHTQLILMKKIPACRQAEGSYEILGETRDDAAGECFDKCAKILGLGYPGGPAIATLAGKLKILNLKFKINLPRPMMYTKDYDFSFSGLKTAVLYAWRKIEKSRFFVWRQKIANLKIAFAAEIQQAVIDVLLKKTIKAIKDYKAKALILGGGVSANHELRRQLKEAMGKINGSHCQYEPFLLMIPPENLSTDNAVMTAVTAYFHRNKKIGGSDLPMLKAEANLRIG